MTLGFSMDYQLHAQTLIGLDAQGQEDFRQEKVVNHIPKRRKTKQELHMNARIGDSDMDFIILYMVFDVNILTKKTWESTGNPNLVWSPIHLILDN